MKVNVSRHFFKMKITMQFTFQTKNEIKKVEKSYTNLNCLQLESIFVFNCGSTSQLRARHHGGWARSKIYFIFTTFSNNLRRPSLSEKIGFCLNITSFPGYAVYFWFEFLQNKKLIKMTLETKLFSFIKYQPSYNLDLRENCLASKMGMDCVSKWKYTWLK